MSSREYCYYTRMVLGMSTKDSPKFVKEDIMSKNHEDGICPCCGAEIEYVGAYDHDDDGATLDWTCPKCGASGKAGYTFVFDQHYCVQDGDGNPVE